LSNGALLDGSVSGAINRADNPEDRNLGERGWGSSCRILARRWDSSPRIVQSPKTVSIYYDTGHGQGWQRIIYITDRPHIPAKIRHWWGNSVAHWEGTTLVVDVTNFNPKKEYQGSRENLHLTDALRASTPKSNIRRRSRMTTWTRPWTVKEEWTRQNEEANRVYYEPCCHEGDYGMASLLVGARADEAAFAKGKGPAPATICIENAGRESPTSCNDGPRAEIDIAAVTIW
jgi:hypothetical protein